MPEGLKLEFNLNRWLELGRRYRRSGEQNEQGPRDKTVPGILEGHALAGPGSGKGFRYMGWELRLGPPPLRHTECRAKELGCYRP